MVAGEGGAGAGGEGAACGGGARSAQVSVRAGARTGPDQPYRRGSEHRRRLVGAQRLGGHDHRSVGTNDLQLQNLQNALGCVLSSVRCLGPMQPGVLSSPTGDTPAAKRNRVPRHYQRVEIQYSRLGVEDFDFGYAGCAPSPDGSDSGSLTNDTSRTSMHDARQVLQPHRLQRS